MPIEINSVDVDQVRVFEISGNVDSVTAIQLGEELTYALRHDVVRLVLDLGAVKYLTSAGIREIISAYHRAHDQGGDLRLANLAPQVSEVLLMTGLDRELSVYATRDEAVHSFA